MRYLVYLMEKNCLNKWAIAGFPIAVYYCLLLVYTLKGISVYATFLPLLTSTSSFVFSPFCIFIVCCVMSCRNLRRIRNGVIEVYVGQCESNLEISNVFKSCSTSLILFSLSLYSSSLFGSSLFFCATLSL